MKQLNKKEAGFTLVELAIVMIIIGLLIGGVLKGQQLIDNAKVNATIRELKSYQTAYYSFRDTYGGLPGDFAEAENRVPGCGGLTAGGNWCEGGNGDSIIGFSAPSPRSLFNTNINNAETNQAWKHMALAGLISGVAANANVDIAGTGELFWGDSHPVSSLRGGYEIFYDPQIIISYDGFTPSFSSSHVLRLSNDDLQPGGGTNNILFNPGGNGQHPLSPIQAAQIDRKIDNGSPEGGVFFSPSSIVSLLPGVGSLPTIDVCTVQVDGSLVYAEAEHGEKKTCVGVYVID